MKIKGCMKKLKVKTAVISGAAIAAVLTVLRFYQLSSLTDASSGFFTDKSSVTVPVFYVLWGALILVPLALTYFSGNVPSRDLIIRKNPLHFAGCGLMSAALFPTAVSKFSAVITEASLRGMGLMNYVRAEKKYIALLYAAFALLAAVFFAAEAFGFLLGGKWVAKLRICRLFPVLWAFCVTIEYFSITVSYLNVPQLLMLIFGDAFLMLFLFEYAKIVSGIATADSVHAFVSTGIISAGMLAAAEIPSFVFRILGKTELIVKNCSPRAFNIAAIVFIISAMTVFFGNRNTVIPDPMLEPAKENGVEEKAELTAEDTAETGAEADA